MSATLISVLMPVRKMRAYTHLAISSILDQCHQNLELILIGQADQALPSEMQPNKRVRWITREQPGIVGALNTGLANAKGEYITRMDDDDIAHPERLSIQLDHLLTHQLDICGARVRFFNESEQIGEGNQRYAKWLNGLTSSDAINRSIFIESPIPHPTFFAHKRVWQQLGGYEDNHWPEDYDLLLRAWQLGLSMGKPEQILLDWREHPNRLTYTDSRYSRQSFTNAKAAMLCASIDAFGLDKRPIWIAGTGRNSRNWFDALQNNGVKADGFVDLDRADIKSSKRDKPVVSYESFRAESADRFLIIALGSDEARKQAVDWCLGVGMMEMADFVAG
ncbi:MAG: glycosyltransferase family 2 protein [Granulosicoccaceae bacterium]